MDPSRGIDSRYNLNYSMSGIGLSLADQADLYGNPAAILGTGGLGGAPNNRPPSGGLIQPISGRNSSNLMHNTTSCQSLSEHQQTRGLKRTSSDCYDDHHRVMNSQQMQQSLDCQTAGNGSLEGGGQLDEQNYNSVQPNKKSPPANGKKTKGRVKIKMEYIDNKLRRYTTFSKRKTGIMKKAYELSTLTGTQVMLLVASETGHVYTFATRKLQPMITSEAGKQLIQTCLNSPDPPPTSNVGDQRMSATGFEETELSYNIADEDSKVRQLIYSHGHHGHAHLGHPQASSHYGLEQSLMQSPYSGGQPSPLSHAQYAPSPVHSGHPHHSHVPHPHSTHMSHAHSQR